MEITNILQAAPMLVFPVTAWLVYRVHQLETQILQDIKTDIAEVKNDMRWLIKYHEDKNG